jgi:PadR family transcriptional regulator, regulatory protein PadR
MDECNIRLTRPMLKVLHYFLDKPREKRSGAEISKAIGVNSGTLYPILARFERAGWLASDWEQIDPREAGRPRRRFYRLTGVGQRAAHTALADLQMPRGELAWTS